MNSDLVPAAIAASGGSALVAGIWIHERRADEAMRASRVRLGLRFPVALEPLRAFAALDGLSGLAHTTELVAEVVAGEGSIAHFLLVPVGVRSSVVSTMTGVIGGLRLTDAPSSPGEAVTLGLRLFVPTPSVLSADGVTEASRALLAGLATLRADERVIVRFALRPGSPRPLREPDAPDRRAREIARAWRRKTAIGGFTVSGLVLVRAATMDRARELAGHIESVIRSRRGLAGDIRITAGRGNRRLSALPRTTRTSGWLSTPELVPLLGWPLSPGLVPGVEVGAARELLVPRHVPRAGRELFIGRDALGERPVALSAEAAKHHMAVVGPAGVGKSVLLARSVLSDIEQGYAGAVIDPKADLLATILDRVPARHADRIVVLDPGDTSRPTPGVAVLSGGDPDLRADVLTGALRSAFPQTAWGVRTDYYLRLAIRTLSEVPGATLAQVGELFFNDSYRRAAIAALRDPFLISSWRSYEGLSSAAARAEHVQAPLNRVMALLSRPAIRSVLATPAPKLDVARLFAERKWLLVSLAPGALGESGAAIVGAALMYVIWSAIEGRVALPAEQRSPAFIYVDELATVTNGLPFSFELLAERARGLGAGLSVAAQTLSRIPEPTRSALLGNVATFITFRGPAEEAQRLARQLPGLDEADVMGLSRFEVAARVGTGSGSAVSVVTGRTEPLPPPTGQAQAIRDASAARYGTPAEQESASTQLPDGGGGEVPLGRGGRAS
jgi:hypothetical protein